ncbi:hydrogenase maturation protease [Sulfolobus sp. S-194]|uniref:hydrogenase maturation protease n=1 Tax=Sulfolobus sp. S-194 TaxID=2512240 RepID=UPI001436F781|nr:hydrogenase maturation protease [Sulfolobus sp. S-194]QIW23924.1 hydrogenase maturation protease [Sulfolobus sp. S-194]
MSKIIIGVGNRLMGDDGFGSCLAEILKEFIFNADVIDLGLSPLFNIELDNYNTIIILDIANINDEYGIYELKANQNLEPLTHDLGLSILLKMYDNKKFYLIACKPESIDIREGLSEKCIERIEKILPIFKRFLEEQGIKTNFNIPDIIRYIKEKCVYNPEKSK